VNCDYSFYNLSPARRRRFQESNHNQKERITKNLSETMGSCETSLNDSGELLSKQDADCYSLLRATTDARAPKTQRRSRKKSTPIPELSFLSFFLSFFAELSRAFAAKFNSSSPRSQSKTRRGRTDVRPADWSISHSNQQLNTSLDRPFDPLPKACAPTRRQRASFLTR